MADGRREFEYDVAIDQITMLANYFGGQFKPGSSNPYRDLDRIKPDSGPVGAREKDRGFALLGVALGQIAKGRKNAGNRR